MKWPKKLSTALLALACMFSSKTLYEAPLGASRLSAALSDEDFRCAAYIVWKEARSESLEGQKMVFSVLSNRAKRDKMSICDVAKAKGQFDSYKGSMTVTKEMLDNFVKVYMLEASDEPSEATHFHDTSVKPWWSRKMQIVKRVGNFIFYKEK